MTSEGKKMRFPRMPKFAAWLALGLIVGASFTALAAQTNYLGTIFVADPNTPTRQMTVNADGSINTNGTSGPATSTPAAPDISTITTGGTAVNAFSAGHCAKGCMLINPSGATQPMVVNGVGTASGTVTNGANIAIPVGGQFAFTARTNAISAISSDSAHTFGGEGYQ